MTPSPATQLRTDTSSVSPPCDCVVRPGRAGRSVRLSVTRARGSDAARTAYLCYGETNPLTLHRTCWMSALLPYLWTSGRLRALGWGSAPVWTCFWPGGDARFRRAADSSAVNPKPSLSHSESAARECAARRVPTCARVFLEERHRFF